MHLEVREGLGGPPKGTEGAVRHTRRSGRDRKVHPKVSEGSGSPPRGPGGPTEGPGWVGSPTQRSKRGR